MVCMKYLLFTLLFFFTPAYSQAQDGIEIFHVPNFQGGVITRYNPALIPDNSVQWARNVYFDQLGVTRRNGFSQFNSSVFTDEKSVRGAWPYTASDGTAYVLALSSQTIYKATSIGVFEAIPGLYSLSTVNDMDAVAYLGKIWFANGVDSMAYWDATSTKTVTEGPLGNLIDGWRNRIVTAGVAGSLSYVYMSKALDGEEWTTGPTTSIDPVALAFGGENAKPIKCLYAGFKDFLFVGNDDEIYGVYGFGRNDFIVRTISREVGCIEDRSIQEKDGALFWMSRRGIEKMTSGSIEPQFSGVKNIFDTLIGNTAVGRNKIYTTQAHWEAGNLQVSGPGAKISATISPGSLVPSTWTHTDTTAEDWSTGTLVNISTTQVSGDIQISSNSYSVLDDFNDTSSSWTIVANTDANTRPLSVEGGTTAFSANGTNGTCGNEDSLGGVGRFCMYCSPATSICPSGDGNQKLYYSTSAYSYGKWGLTARTVDRSGGQLGTILKYYFISSTIDTATTSGYYFEFNTYNMRERIVRVESGSETQVSSVTLQNVTGAYSSCDFVITRNLNGDFSVTSSTTTGFSGNACAAGPLTGTDTTITSTSGYQFFHIFLYDIPYASVYGMSIDNLFFGGYNSSGTFTSSIFDTTFPTPIGGPFSFSNTVPVGSTIAYSVRESSTSVLPTWSSWTLVSTTTSGIYRIPLTKEYWQYKADFSTDYSTQTPSLHSITLQAATTGEYIHDCAQTDAINSWGNFQANSVLDNGSISYYVSTGASCDSVERATATWNAQSNNAPIIISTAAYLGIKEIFTISAATHTALLRDVTINWLEGTSRPPTASAVYLERYYMAYTTSSASGRNDFVFVADKNDAVTFLDGMSCYSMAIFNRKLFCGDANSTGKLYQLEIGEDDDGKAFTSEIRTKAYSFGDPDAEKEFIKMYASFAPETESILDINITPSYHLDLSNTAVTLNDVNTGEDSTAGILVSKIPFSVSNNLTGRFLDVEFKNNSSSAGAWTLFNMSLYLRKLPVK